MPLPAAHLVHDSDGHRHLSSGPTLSEARDAYIKLKDVSEDKTFIRGASRNAVECPSDIIDAIGGWTTTEVGQRYGLGQPLDVKAKWMDKLIPL